jgi:hypothetical protein
MSGHWRLTAGSVMGDISKTNFRRVAMTNIRKLLHSDAEPVAVISVLKLRGLVS